MKASKVRLHLTSFGPFLDVTDNPSQRIGERVAQLFADPQDGCRSVELVSHSTLEVSVDAVAAYFNSNGGPLGSASPSPGTEVVELLVHLGVHRGAHGEIRVELQGVNDLHCPQGDFKGRVVIHMPIIGLVDDASNEGDNDAVPSREGQWSRCAPVEHFDDRCTRAGPSSVVPFTSLRCAIPQSLIESAISQTVASLGPPDEERRHKSPDGNLRFPASLVCSDDAGRYLCNYSYCRSLFYTSMRMLRGGDDQAEKDARRCFSLFLHVLDPDLGDKSEGVKNPTIEAQAECIHRFLSCVGESLLSNDGQGSAASGGVDL